MIYLGLHPCLEAGAALVVDGDLVGALHEERFTRIKNHAAWPDHSINYLMKRAGVSWRDVDKVVCGMVQDSLPDAEVMRRIAERMTKGSADAPALADKYKERFLSEIDWNTRFLKDLRAKAEEFGIADRLVLHDHHLSHAASAYYCCPFEDCLVLTCDGKGSFQSSSVYSMEDGRLTRRAFSTTYDSPGYFYGIITMALGFRPHRHEGKITGLAAHGNPGAFRHITDRMLGFEDGEMVGRMGPYYLPWYVDGNALPDLYEEITKHAREDVAAAAQATLEDVVGGWAAHAIERYAHERPSDVALAGGVFANVKLNQRIRELPNVRNVYVHPAMGDGGLPLGGVLVEMMRDGTPLKRFQDSVALGPAYQQGEVRTILDKNGLPYTRPESSAAALVKLFAEGRVVGLFRGRIEYGPRALCHRSIVYHGKDPSVNDWLNRKLNRSEFMPFAPVTTAELAGQCFVGWQEADPSARFMTMTYDCTDEFKRSCPACVHIDGTARPQVVHRESDPELHGLLSDYHRLTGELAMVNTSFNNHEEPIVCSIEDALASFRLGNVDALLIEGYLVVEPPASDA